MKLSEFEGKELFRSVGISVPESIVVTADTAGIDTAAIDTAAIDTGGIDTADFSNIVPAVVKPQILSGRRGKAGAIHVCETNEDVQKAVSELIGSEVLGEKVQQVLIEKKLEISGEYYFCITYDTYPRAPVVIVCREGGMDIEEAKKHSPDKVVSYIINPTIVSYVINPTSGLMPWQARAVLLKAGFSGKPMLKLSSILVKLWKCFEKYDCRVAEINPLIETTDGEFFACDSKIVIDDDALYRQKLGFEERSAMGREPTKIELKAHEIDKDDHRGTAGSTFIELDGDIAVLASGGGASLACMDALIDLGGRPANYTEYSGNPPAEKVQKLTEVTLSKPGLNGCWVVGGTANFTDIYETLRGFLEGIRKVKPDYPIVVRRAGPRDKEAYDMLKKAAREEGFDIHLFGADTPMTATAKDIIELSNKYKEKNEK